ncbi:sugar-binding transcriptional regulator [Sporosarcina sp. HYO08]|uniref:sugar-binding transcriptional regulator n=1 Tax=Sporosarcina sp. HYO08 TaxID=1759557 RepID=UPI00079483D9|nr:sugar-binding domain-containing protein [Sporosarcina sp. HYO08]KXH79273.1 hypothetical protein AU377_11855 [Sporosarcina sp. HYO08]
MERIIEAQRMLIPEMIDTLEQRYRLVKLIKMAGPIGRRPLAQLAELSERETRTIMDILRTQQIIRVEKEGATITDQGVGVLETLEIMMEDWSGRAALAKKLATFLGIRSVKVVAGNSDDDKAAKQAIGAETAKKFAQDLGKGKIVAVTGGSTMASIPSHLDQMNKHDDLLFIAARGGVGDDIGLQANVIAASFANACGGKYSTLYYPESLSPEAHAAFRKEPSVRKMLALYEATDCVLHGIGDAHTMAAVRNTDNTEKQMLLDNGAKGEAFGYYFDQDGNVVHRILTVGIQTDHLDRVPLIIAAAGGASKAEAILSYMASAPKQTILVTDEGAANEMMKRLINK